MANISPVIFKLKFYKPSKYNKSVGAKNSAHIKYIATRPGVDKGELTIGDNDCEDDLDSPAAYLKYADERPRSHGLFTRDEDRPDLDLIRQEVREHKGIVWRSVISLREEDATRLGYTDRNAWMNLMRTTVPDMLNGMGLSEQNTKWVAAFHAEKGHPHVHLVFWQEVPVRTTGKLSPDEFKCCKRALVRNVFAEERSKLLAQKTAMRDLIRDLAKDDMSKALDLIIDVEQSKLYVKGLNSDNVGLPPKVNDEKVDIIANHLTSLASMLPDKGRMFFSYMPENVKDYTCDIADWLMKQPGYIQSVESFMKAAEDTARHYTINEDSIKAAGKRAYSELLMRVSNIVLKGAATIHWHDKQIEFQKFHEAISVTNIAKGVLKGAWIGIEKERIRNEAQAEYLKRRLAQQKTKSKGNIKTVGREDERER